MHGQRHVRFLLASCLVLGAACGRVETPPGDAAAAPADAAASEDVAPDLPIGVDAAPREGGFGPVGGLDPGGLARRVGDDFHTAGQALLTAPDGTGWLYWRGYANPSFTAREVHIERFDADGVLARRSDLEAHDPDAIVLHPDGSLTGIKSRCGPRQVDSCFLHDPLTGAITENRWPASPRSVRQYQLDAGGNVVGVVETTVQDRFVPRATAQGRGLYALVHQGGMFVARFDQDAAPVWSTELVPVVLAPALAPDAPIAERIRAARLTVQLSSEPVTVDDGVVVAVAMTRGSLAALAAARGLDPRCPDIVVVHLSPAGTSRYHAVPTPECEQLPQLTVVDNHAVVSSVVQVARTPEPNDTFQYDIGLAIVDLATGAAITRTIAMGEDDVVQTIAPCGPARVCLAGETGAKTVDTGSTVSFGTGFVLPVSVTGEAGKPWHVTSPRHAEVLLLAPRPGGVVFFATVNGPITHTAEGNPALGFNEALLGTVQRF
jgi:hypothetical protein